MKSVVIIAIVAVAMIGIPNAFAETILYEDNYLDFSIEIDDWWDVIDETLTSATFYGDGKGFGEVILYITFDEGIPIENHQEGVKIIRSTMDNYCSEENCKFMKELPDKNNGITTIDKKMAYQVGYNFQIGSDVCSALITTIPDADDSWSMIGVACGKSHWSFFSSLKDSTKSFHLLNTSKSQPTYSDNQSIYIPPSIQVPTASKFFKSNDLNFSINHPADWLVNEYPDYVEISDIVTGMNGFYIDYFDEVYYSDYSDSKKLSEIVKLERDDCDDSTFKNNSYTCKNFELAFSQSNQLTNNYSVFQIGYSVERVFLYDDNVTLWILVTEHHIGNEVWVVTSLTFEEVFSEYSPFLAEMHLSLNPFPSPIKNNIPTDTVPPQVLVPEDILVETHNGNGDVAIFNPIAIDNVDEMITPVCNHDSGSIFHIGKTTVTCTAIDSAGNSASNSFVVTIVSLKNEIPPWIKNVAEFWHAGEISDDSFIQGIQYLIKEGIMEIPPTTQNSGTGSGEIPSWVKNNAGWWADGSIDDDSFIQGIQYLIKEGIISIS